METSIKSLLNILVLLYLLSSTVESLTMSSWESNLRDIIVKNKRVVESKYITFTTVSESGWPAARTVVFRGFHNQDNKVYLKFISDSRAHKINDIAKCNKVELCWYLTKNKDQFRIKGYATSIGITSTDEKNARLRVQSWNGLSDGARAPFFFPGHPGDEVSDTDKLKAKVANPAAKADSLGNENRNENRNENEDGTENLLREQALTEQNNSIDSSSQSKVDSASDDVETSADGETIFNQKKNKKFVPIIPDQDTVRALRAERKTGEEEPSKIQSPPPDCFNIILVDPISGNNRHKCCCCLVVEIK